MDIMRRTAFAPYYTGEPILPPLCGSNHYRRPFDWITYESESTDGKPRSEDSRGFRDLLQVRHDWW